MSCNKTTMEAEEGKRKNWGQENLTVGHEKYGRPTPGRFRNVVLAPLVQCGPRPHQGRVSGPSPHPQSSLVPWGGAGAVSSRALGRRRLQETAGLPGVVRVRLWGWQGGTRRKSRLERFLGGFQVPMGLASQQRPPWSPKGCARAVWPRGFHSPPWGTPGVQGGLAPGSGGVVSADSSRGGHSTDSLSPTSGPLLCPVPAPE